MIFYKSTRGNSRLYTFSQAILKGIAPDGGLFVPSKIPIITKSRLRQLTGKSYQEKARFVLNLFQTDLTRKTVKKAAGQAYSSNFDHPQIAPLTHLKNNQYLLELWHGPTAAFKDLALQIMPFLFLEAVKKNQKPDRFLVLTATSGDTGKAALEGYKNKKGLLIAVFYPDGHISYLQKLQMITQEGSNVLVCGLKGDFDDVQRCVKVVFNDEKFKQELLNQHKVVLSSANSINWGRLIPQIIYHISSYADLVSKKVIVLGDAINIAVPTGNFGNILAAYYAKKMGLPVNIPIVLENTRCAKRAKINVRLDCN